MLQALPHNHPALALADTAQPRHSGYNTHGPAANTDAPEQKDPQSKALTQIHIFIGTHKDKDMHARAYRVTGTSACTR